MILQIRGIHTTLTFIAIRSSTHVLTARLDSHSSVLYSSDSGFCSFPSQTTLLSYRRSTRRDINIDTTPKNRYGTGQMQICLLYLVN